MLHFHEWIDCPYLVGYDGRFVSEADIMWLDRVRMLRRHTVPREAAGGPAECFSVTNIGAYTQGQEFVAPGEDTPLEPNRDGFLLHDACFNILHLVHYRSELGQRPLSFQRLYLLMQANLLGYPYDFCVDWEEVYGHAGECNKKGEWDLALGNASLVVDPMKPIDFSTIVWFAENDETDNLERVATRTPLTDPFTEFPFEIRQMILDLLPLDSIANLRIASPAFHATCEHLPSSFWRFRRAHDFPWLDESTLRLYINRQRDRGHDLVDYRKLHLLLSHFSEPFEALPRETELSLHILQNLPRIWNGCEVILEKMRPSILQLVSEELLGLVNIRLASIRTMSYYGQLMDKEIYFVSRVQDTLNMPAPRGVTAWFNSRGAIVGIGWLIGATTYTIGNKTKHEVHTIIPDNAVITGIALSFNPVSDGTIHNNPNDTGNTGNTDVTDDTDDTDDTDGDEDDEDRTIRGLGISTSTTRPILLGSWSRTNIQIFQPNKTQPGIIVGIAAHYNVCLLPSQTTLKH
ncbi:hypothetical protein BDW59DRAFT_159743 [Aspergillus cavernicola]|uniref:F-box domain-containing protein n=1 Tax=Aspergillus cavernicola TaxID=176166 RepID=A0ABR4IMN6_9EURO